MRYYTSGTARVIYAVSIGVSTVDSQAPELIQKENSTSVILRKAAKGTMVDWLEYKILFSVLSYIANNYCERIKIYWNLAS